MFSFSFSFFLAPVKQWLLPWQYYKTRQDNYIHATDEVIRVLEKVNAILEFSGVAVLSLIEFFPNSEFLQPIVYTFIGFIPLK